MYSQPDTCGHKDLIGLKEIGCSNDVPTQPFPNVARQFGINSRQKYAEFIATQSSQEILLSHGPVTNFGKIS